MSSKAPHKIKSKTYISPTLFVCSRPIRLLPLARCGGHSAPISICATQSDNYCHLLFFSRARYCMHSFPWFDCECARFQNVFVDNGTHVGVRGFRLPWPESFLLEYNPNQEHKNEHAVLHLKRKSHLPRRKVVSKCNLIVSDVHEFLSHSVLSERNQPLLTVK